MPVCSELLAHGVCHTDLCTASHILDFFCSSCNIICDSERTFKSHLGGRKHRAATKTPTLSNCLHSQGSAHQRRLSQLDVTPDPWYTVTEAEAPINSIRCDTCNQNIPRTVWASHISKDSHIRRSRVANFQSVLRETEKDKHGVEVSYGVGTNSTDGGAEVDFGTIDPNNAQEIKKVVTLRLNTPADITLNSTRLASSAGRSSRVSPQFHVTEMDPIALPLKRLVSLPLYFRSLGHRGYFADRLELTFHDKSLRKSFTITRPLRATVGNVTDLEQLRPSAPYVRPPPKPRRDREEKLVDGIKPSSQRIEWVVELPKAIMPFHCDHFGKSYWSRRQADQSQTVAWNARGFDRRGPPSYSRFWETLLYIEEHQAEIDLERYDQENVELSRHNSYFFLKVPGLAEKRPSVLVGDSIKVRPHKPSEADNKTWYIGYVHIVRKDEVGLRFAHRFVPPLGTRFDVRFCLNRIPVLRMHQALATAFAEPRALFPTIVHEKPHLTRRHVRTVNPLVDQNPPQLLAVKSILSLPPGSPPFIIFGPPGTGKTVTAVESMLQLLLANRTIRVLATAPSNSAADLIARKLLESGKLHQGDLLRLNALSRTPDPDSIHSQVLASSYVRDGSFRFPGVNRLLLADEEYNQYRKHGQNAVKPLKDYRVVVATCVTASVPYQLGIPRGHFDWIFVDEAGQACEPEAMISVKTLAGSETNIVLSGDVASTTRASNKIPNLTSIGSWTQLSRKTDEHGHVQPVFHARKDSCEAFKELAQPSCDLRYSNERFYDNELESCASASVTNSLLAWSELGRTGFPIIFENIAGQDLREASSPSWYNPMEVSRVKDYVRMLRDLRRPHISTTDIGVITPYNQQVQHIRRILRGSNGEGIKVGSVEEFQGQERKVIIVSTVRSSANEVEFDLRHTLGFVANDRRFNVTITRAQALLIIVGDASVLGLDPLWRSFLSYIHQEGGWKGSPIPWEGNEAGNAYSAGQRSAAALDDLTLLIERTRTMNLSLGGGPAGNADDVDVQEGNVDRPWREDE
ncbi:helicase domain-containing protein [Rhizoctonia solani]|uniref:RNA helicase n=1 Tax=Rhizoctonia solani TaxID=456999 RepID=A0A8H8T3C5_9AGAM|nr:helicase domain-containing protein [Rhizoctonia solani]QRW27114.1 helicase domain-containing protein [Rhizoctonia solani]